MDYTDFFRHTERHAAEFAASSTFAEFAVALDGSKPGSGKLLRHIAATYPGQWDSAFLTIKNHGYVGKALLLPKARKVADIFAGVSLYPYQTGPVTRGQSQYIRNGAAFVSALRAPGFCYFGHLGADYALNEHGHKQIKNCSGKMFLTGAQPTHAVTEAYGAIVGPEEFDLSTFEIVQREDGRLLVVANTNCGFGARWLALLDAGESALTMLDDHERGEIAAEIERRDTAWRAD